jgi:hypothetical protein
MATDDFREPIDPNRIFRECEARDIFGFGTSQLKEMVKAGVIPKPKLLAPPPSRAKGWYGYQIIEWRNRVDAEQEQWAADRARNFYVPKGGDNVAHTNKEAAKAVAAKPKMKKRRLRRLVKS